MRNFARSIAIVVLMLLAPLSAAHAQLGFMFGLALGSSGHGIQGDSNGTLLYVMPRASERVKDPLSVRLLVTNPHSGRSSGLTLREHFENGLSGDDASKYEILQVLQVAHQGRADLIALWIVYIEKEKVIPLKDLPPLEKK